MCGQNAMLNQFKLLSRHNVQSECEAAYTQLYLVSTASDGG